MRLLHLEGVVRREVDVEEEDSAGVGAVVRSHDGRLPVVTSGRAGGGEGRVGGEGWKRRGGAGGERDLVRSFHGEHAGQKHEAPRPTLLQYSGVYHVASPVLKASLLKGRGGNKAQRLEVP